ncbi:MAG: entericidin A/B family lipoprotein [Betaproteobacteria bacterium]
MKRIAVVLFAIISTLSLLACNTIQGVGKDIEKGGQAIERAATK